MIYYLTAFIVGIAAGIAVRAIVSSINHSDAGALKIAKDEDGTYCFLVLKKHPDDLKDGDSITLIVDRSDTAHK